MNRIPKSLQGFLLALAGYFDASFTSGLLLILIHNAWGKPIAIEIMGLGFVAQAVLWIPLSVFSVLIYRKNGFNKTLGFVLISFVVTLIVVVGFFAIFLNY